MCVGHKGRDHPIILWERACSGRRSDDEALPATTVLTLPERSRYFVRPFLKGIADTLCLTRRNRLAFFLVLQEFGMNASSVPGSTTDDRLR
jgi:hypothetical protein